MKLLSSGKKYKNRTQSYDDIFTPLLLVITAENNENEGLLYMGVSLRVIETKLFPSLT
jgi:hypothetical protein